jgi:penicillin amidase
MPILAGDPHLPHSLPCVVFQQHLSCPGLDVIGMTVPGVPYVIFGHNEEVAWTITAAMADVLDLYVEKPDPDRADRVAGPGGPEPMVTDSVVVRIRDGSEFTERTARVRRTPRGPLLNDMYPGLIPARAPLVSIHGIPTQVAGTLRSLRLANQAGNVRELREAMIGLQCPIASVAAADVGGDIALFASGTVPVREHHRGTFPAPGWLDRYRWQGPASPPDIPFCTGRGRDYFVNTNNLMIDPDRTRVLFQIDSAPSYRRDRVVEMLEALDEHTVASTERIQGDVELIRARRILPALLRDLEGGTPLERRARELLAGWDCRADVDSAACSIFFATYREAILGAVRDEADAAGVRFLVSFRYFTNGADLWFEEPGHPVWDDRSTGERETRADIVRAAFARAVAWLREEFDDGDPDSWRWGELHTLEPQHALGSKLRAYNLPRRPQPGASTSVWKAHFDMGRTDHPFRSMYGPVLRIVVDLADIRHAFWIIGTGSSGWPNSPHYADQHERWRRVDLAPMVSDWTEIERDANAVLTLR